MVKLSNDKNFDAGSGLFFLFSLFVRIEKNLEFQRRNLFLMFFPNFCHNFCNSTCPKG